MFQFTFSRFSDALKYYNRTENNNNDRNTPNTDTGRNIFKYRTEI